MNVFFIVLILLTAVAFGQKHQNEINGNFKISDSSRPIKFLLRYSEENGRVTGEYKDNFFSYKSPVFGVSNPSGITLDVVFQEKKRFIKTITFLIPITKSGEFPLNIIPRDNNGNALLNLKTVVKNNVTPINNAIQMQEESSCVEGFGKLERFCGIYSGILTEEQDRRNRCNLLFSDAIRLELNNEASIILHLGEVNEFIATEAHLIGRLPFNPQKNSIDIMTRSCGPLSGVNSSSSSCKILHLQGNFLNKLQTKHFVGTYEIREEGTNLYCRYSLSMDRMKNEE